MRKTPMTYARAGVDINQKSKAIASLVGKLKYRREGKGNVMDIKGQFEEGMLMPGMHHR